MKKSHFLLLFALSISAPGICKFSIFKTALEKKRFLTASVNRGPCNTYACVVPDFSPKSLENAYTGGQNAKRIFALSFEW